MWYWILSFQYGLYNVCILKLMAFFLIFYRKLALHIETVFFATFLCVLYISGGDNAKSLSVQSSPGHISLHIQEICHFFLYLLNLVSTKLKSIINRISVQ